MAVLAYATWHNPLYVYENVTYKKELSAAFTMQL